MGLDWVRFSLRGYGGAKPTGTAFFELVGVKPRDRFELTPSDEPWQAAVIDLLTVDSAECQAAEEPAEEFARRVNVGLKRVAKWLAARSPRAFTKWRTGRKKADVFVGGWITSDQLELTFPAEFLLACGRLGLPIEICTND
jgi:hypothetical protein